MLFCGFGVAVCLLVLHIFALGVDVVCVSTTYSRLGSKLLFFVLYLLLCVYCLVGFCVVIVA